MMKQIQVFASGLALIGVAAPAAADPRTAAAFGSSNGQAHSDIFMFSGATVRLALDGRGARRPEFGLRFAGGLRTEGRALRLGDGIGLAMTPGTQPRLTMAGQDSRQFTKRLHMSDGATAAVVVGGLVVIGAIVAFAVTPKVPDDVW